MPTHRQPDPAGGKWHWLPSVVPASWRPTLQAEREHFRGRRPGGSPTPAPSALDGLSPRMVELVAMYTGWSAGGPSRVARVRLGLPAVPSRITAPIGSGSGHVPASVMDGQPGTPGMAANQPADLREHPAYQRGWADGFDYASGREW